MNRTRARWCHWATFGCSDAWVLGALAIVIATVAMVWTGLVLRPWGGPGFTPALPLSVVFALGAGARVLGLRLKDLHAWAPVYIGLGVALLALGRWFATEVSSSTEALSFVVGALEEEIVFRLALPLATGGIVAMALGRPGGDPARWGRLPRAVALVSAGVAFVVMPGHLEQMSNLLAAIPFAATALLFTYVMLRTGALLPGVLAHAALNIATVCFLNATMSRTAWSVIVVCVLGAYAFGAEQAGRRLGYLLVTPAPTPALVR